MYKPNTFMFRLLGINWRNINRRQKVVIYRTTVEHIYNLPNKLTEDLMNKVNFVLQTNLNSANFFLAKDLQKTKKVLCSVQHSIKIKF